MRSRLVPAFALVLLLSARATVRAHSLITYSVPPDSWSSAAGIPDPDVSRVIYRELATSATRTWIRFRGVKGQRISFNLGVPVLGRLSAFRPLAALVGPGLPLDPGTPLERPPGSGAVVLRPQYPPETPPPVFHESFTGTDSWMLLEDTVVLPEDGEYYLVAFAPDSWNAPAKLWLAIGTKERFTLREIFELGKVKRFVREFHETR